MTDYALIEAGNYHKTRILNRNSSQQTTPIFCVQHITAGLSDYIAPDMSADNTQNWGKNPASNVSWHDICDSDSAITCLPGSYTAWHAAGYNSRSIGQEIGTGSTDWNAKSRLYQAWVEAVLKNSAKLWAPHVIKYGIPLRKVTKAQVDAELAKGRNAKPLGFIGHGDLDPRNRTDPGLYKGKDTFPWERLFQLIAAEVARLQGKASVDTGAKDATKVTIDSFDGVLGPKTIRAWQTYYSLGKRYPSDQIDGKISEPSLLIAEVQKDLARVGLYKDKVDGMFGPNTKAALAKRFDVTGDKRMVQALQFDLWKRGLIR